MILQQPFAIPPRTGIFSSPISINAAQVPSTQTDFPVLVSQTDNRFKTIANGGHVADSNGYDIRPYSDSGLTTAITGYELERYNASTGEVIMWVKVASLSSSTTPIYLRYGDASLNTDGSSITTWDANFDYVFHMKDGSTLSVYNSKTGNNATNNSVTAATGQIDGCGGFVSASSQFIGGDRTVSGNSVTISAWVKATSFPAAYNAVGGANNGSNFAILLVKSNGKLAPYTSASNYDGTGANTLSTGTWYYLAMTYDTSAGLVGYFNGSSDNTAAAGASTGISGITADVGKDSVNGRYWNGSIDEWRMSKVVRSADWITTEYNNQSAPGTFETLGAES